jgi:hypothetical protein
MGCFIIFCIAVTVLASIAVVGPLGAIVILLGLILIAVVWR